MNQKEKEDAQKERILQPIIKTSSKLDNGWRVRKNIIVKGVEDGWLLQFVSEIVKLGFKLD